MANTDSDPEVTELLADLTMELRRLQREVEPERPRGLPTRHDMARFTSEVAIPALILLLQTQIRALELLRRTIRLAEGRDPTNRQRAVRTRAEQLGDATLAQLDTVLTELHAAIEGRPENDRARQLLDEAKTIQREIRDELDVDDSSDQRADTEIDSTQPTSDALAIDVEEELRSLKGELEGSDGDGGDNRDGDDGTGANGDET